MKTLLFTLEYPPFHGGVANYYGNLVKYWPPAAGDIFVLRNNDGELINEKLPILKWLPAISALWKKIKDDKINYLLVGQILPLGTAAYFLSKFKKINYSVILHGMDLTFALKTQRKRWLAKRILNHAGLIICANSYVARLVADFIGKKNKIKVVNPGVDKIPLIQNEEIITRIKKKNNLRDKVVLLTVGRLVKRKGVAMVLESLPTAIKEAPNLIYIIVGKGPEIGNLKSKISALKLENHVIIITDAGDEERNAWYILSDIFIMVSRQIGDDFEGFGIVYLEANLAGKPVIAGASGGAGDAVVNNLNGLLVNPESREEITAAIIKLYKNKELRIKLGARGRERALKKFSWQKQISKIYNFISRNH